MMNVGAMRDRIQLQTYLEVVDPASAGTLRTWTTFATVWANLTAVSDYVTFQSQQIDEKITHKITCRFFPGMTTEWWVLFENRRFRIRGVKNIDERDIQMELNCEEIKFAS